MKKIGIISSNEELIEQLKSYQEQYDVTIIPINLKDYNNEFMDLDYCIVRSTGSKMYKVRQFILNNPHIDFIDNIERFFDEPNKIKTSEYREKEGTGAKIINTITSNCFPIVAKPINGRKNEDLTFIHNMQEFNEWKVNRNPELQFMFQEKLPLIDEFRVLVFNINNNFKYFLHRKRKHAGVRTKYKATSIKQAKRNIIDSFIKEKRMWKKGIIGYDIGLLPDMTCKIIEENRSPEYEKAENCHNISFAEETIKSLII